VALVASGIVGGAVLLAGALALLLRLLVDGTIGSFDLADPDHYDVRFSDCTADADSAVFVAGTFTNTDTTTRTYELRLVAELDDETVGLWSLPVDLEPGGTMRFARLIDSSGPPIRPDDPVDCRAVVYQDG